MSLRDLTDGDFQYFKRRASDMRNCHEAEFIKRSDPELMSAFYRGRNKKYDEADDKGFYSKRENFLTLSRIFTATNTLGPQLYYQNPQPIVTPCDTGTREGAARLASALRKNMKDNDAEEQNTEACLSAWFFGLGWKKIGMRNTFISRTPEPESQAQGNPQTNQADEMEPVRQDYFLDRQQFFNDSENPMNVMLDDKTDLRNGKLRLHRVSRSLYDLNNSGAYDNAMLAEIYDKLKNNRGSRLDARDINLHLNELQIKFPTGLWILSWVDEHNKGLRYDLSTYQEGFQLLPLLFTNEPFVRYPIAHMKVASQVQSHLDNMATLFVKTVDRVRNQFLVDENALKPGMKDAFEKNKIGGIIYTNRPVSQGVVQAIQSAAVQNDLPTLMNLVQANLTELLGQDELSISGKSKNETLGQDELARVGTKVRESGMNDKVRKWVIKQFEQESFLMQNFGQAPMTLKLQQRDYAQLPVGETIQDSYQSFGTPEQPMPFKESVPGKYEYDMNVYEAVKPDKKVLQAEYLDAIQIFSKPEIQQAAAMSGFKYNVGVLASGVADNFEYLKSREFVEQLDPAQQAAYQTALMMMNGGMQQTTNPQGKEQPTKIDQQGKSKSAQGVSQPSSAEASFV